MICAKRQNTKQKTQIIKLLSQENSFVDKNCKITVNSEYTVNMQLKNQ